MDVGSAIWAGIVGTAVMTALTYMAPMHPRPPEMTMNSMAVVGILLGHAVFGLVVALTYSV